MIGMRIHKKVPMNFNVITIFPDLISHYCAESILGRAQVNDIVAIKAIQLRDFAIDKHKKVDDTPYGGGAGMVIKPDTVYRALKKLKALKSEKRKAKKSKHTVLMSPRGRQFDQRLAEEWSKLKEITFVCGRYEGVDQRVADHMVDEDISIGPYVLAGGELGALVIIEAISRLLPGVLGNEESLKEETFGLQLSDFRLQKNIRSKKNAEVRSPTCLPARQESESQLEYPQYTKPADFMGWCVPEVLLSGDHKKIAEWRKLQTQ